MRPHTFVTIGFALAAIPAASLHAQIALQVAPSGRGTTEVTITPVDSAARAAVKPSMIRVDYGQPHLRGRKILTDSLIPYDKVWRTGANAATTLTTDVDLVLGGVNLPKGKYILSTLPSRSGWKLLVQREPTQPPVPDAPYDVSREVARIDLKQTALAAPIESFTMWLIPSREPGAPRGQLVMAWSNVSLATDWSVR
ncbi:MAG TPA: DUF2911 domain-containing protein [Gemmatimonadaceae bacterium]|nr:DUF2911 domain-containing protein [Gemmatimonadaceae bacterium]